MLTPSTLSHCHTMSPSPHTPPILRITPSHYPTPTTGHTLFSLPPAGICSSLCHLASLFTCANRYIFLFMPAGISSSLCQPASHFLRATWHLFFLVPAGIISSSSQLASPPCPTATHPISFLFLSPQLAPSYPRSLHPQLLSCNKP